ncbi:MAG: amidase [Pseudomonadota bacterium]
MDLTQTSALDLSRAIAAKDISVSELMQATLARIESVNPQVNAVVSLRDRDALMAEARAVENKVPSGWLYGIPMAIKDLVNVTGLPTSFGSPLHRDTVAIQDDLTVARLREAGAIFIGKTNTPEFGLGSHTVNPVHGATRNPYDLSRSAGGSSGGAAVALATGMLSVADGSDMMGSLRNPAGWNNVYGLRPTWGLVAEPSEREAYINQLSTDGPMARTPSDLAALLDTMAGADPRAPQTLSHEPALPNIDGLGQTPRIGWLGDWSGAFPMEQGVLDCCEAALSQMAELSWHIEPVAAPFPAEQLWISWTRMRSYIKAMNMAPEYEDPARRAHLGSAMVWEIEEGLRLTTAEIWDASLIRSNWYRRCAALFKRYDILALPSAQMWPFAVELPHPSNIGARMMDTYHRWMEVVIPAGLIGLPAISVPAGFGDAGLPMGVQLIGAPRSDPFLLKVAQRWHSATEWPQRKPAMLS